MSLEESIAQDFVRFGEEAAKLSSLEFDSITTCWERLGLGYLQSASRCPSHHAELLQELYQGAVHCTSPGHSTIQRLCGLYALYVLYRRQPDGAAVKIRLPLELWDHIEDACKLAEMHHLGWAAAVLSFLLSSGAIQFVATAFVAPRQLSDARPALQFLWSSTAVASTAVADTLTPQAVERLSEHLDRYEAGKTRLHAERTAASSGAGTDSAVMPATLHRRPASLAIVAPDLTAQLEAVRAAYLRERDLRLKQVLARAKPLPGGSSPDVYGPRTMEQADPSRRRSVLRRHALTGDARSRRLSTSSRVAADSTPSRPDTAGFAASSQHKVASANERASQEATQPVGLQSRPAMTTRVVDMPQLPGSATLSRASQQRSRGNLSQHPIKAAASSASSPAVIASQTKPFEEELASSSSEESTDEELVASMELGMAQKRPADDVEQTGGHHGEGKRGRLV